MRFNEYCPIHTAHVEWEDQAGIVEYDGIEQRRPFRAARLVDDSERFLFLYFPRRSRPKAIEKFLLDKVESGLKVDDKTFVSFILHVRISSNIDICP